MVEKQEVRPFGWQLWYQPVAESLEKFGIGVLTRRTTQEIWLSADGELVAAEVTNYFDSARQKESSSSTTGLASDDYLRQPECEWTEIDTSPPEDPSVLQRREWRALLPIETAPYGGVEQALRLLQARASAG